MAGTRRKDVSSQTAHPNPALRVARLGAEPVPESQELSELRNLMRRGKFRSTTSGLVVSRLHVNLIHLPQSLAEDFRAFCDLNPGCCPLIEQTPPGVAVALSAPYADLRTDLPGYCIYRDGGDGESCSRVDEFWLDDGVSFLLGCSFGFEHALVLSGVPMRHHRPGATVPMYRTNRPTIGTAHFSGPLVVSMRAVPRDRLERVIAITSAQAFSHGGPIHVGEPQALGIEDLATPDYGTSPVIEPGDVPVFWPCGVTSQEVLRSAAPSLAITHAPGRMLITDLPLELVPHPG